jgi:16S rRNA (cytidine1402-2'-O)-methyltransferase
VACEDTRRTATLLRAHGIDRPLVPLHEHNEDRRAAELVARMEAGDTLCLVSDAGLPTVSDPGRTLIRLALESDVPVEVLPGASAVTTALVASGLVADRFAFLGFLPRGRSALERLLTRRTGGGCRWSRSSRRPVCRPPWPFSPPARRHGRWPSAAS